MDFLKLFLTSNGVTIAVVIAFLLVYFKGSLKSAKVGNIKVDLSELGGGRGAPSRNPRNLDIHARLDSIVSDLTVISKKLLSIEGDVKNTAQKIEDLELADLRAIIVSPSYPDDVRVNAFDTYTVIKGKNGWIKEYWKNEQPKIQARIAARLANK